jgi:hydrogenase nickel incorporation protein HypA/HybF
MHEMGIANSVLTAVRTAMRRVPGSYPSKVGLRIGQMAAIDQEALRFCFEAITRDTDLEKLCLEIEFRPLRYQCRSCGHEFAVQDYEIQCPNCRSLETEYLSGDELELAYLEVEEHGTNPVGA